MFKRKEHTFVIYNGIITLAEWVFRKFKRVADMPSGWTATLEAPAAVLTDTEYPADQQTVRVVLNDGTEKALVNATINGRIIELAGDVVIDMVAGWAVTLTKPAAVLTEAECPADQQTVCLVLSDGTERPLVNATINSSTVELAAL